MKSLGLEFEAGVWARSVKGRKKEKVELENILTF